MEQEVRPADRERRERLQVGELLGFHEENGFVAQYRDPSIVDDHVWDYANTDPDVRLLVENKSGRMEYAQLDKDEEALREGWNVQYNLRDPISPAQIARLDALRRSTLVNSRISISAEGDDSGRFEVWPEQRDTGVSRRTVRSAVRLLVEDAGCGDLA
ncbi:hypothetical protein [Rhodococcus sp. 14-2483-1-2]|uniref:hypothetical protein n=1 Tax=Rhodococcus sp. 14-2483-1-2 TaxID=2023147 RepID=UPI00113FCBE1|nr:hypothetical protein [Rhodococcus sp. 14-2483-1-2]